MSDAATQEWVIETLRRALEAMNRIAEQSSDVCEDNLKAPYWAVLVATDRALATLPAAQPAQGDCAQPVDAAAVRDAALAEAEAVVRVRAHAQRGSRSGFDSILTDAAEAIAALRRKQP